MVFIYQIALIILILDWFFLKEQQKANDNLDMLDKVVFQQLTNLHTNIILQQDGEPPHWSLEVRGALYSEYPDRRMDR